MINNSITEDEFDEKFIHDLDKMISSQKYGNSVRTLEQIHGDRLRTVKELNNISTLDAFAFEIEVDIKTIRSALNGEKFLPIKGALKIEENYGYSLDWIYGLSDIMVNKDKEFFIDIRKSMKIETKKFLYENNGKIDTKEKDVLIITLSGNQLNLLDCIRKIRQISEDQTLSYVECEEMIDKYEQEFKDRIYSIGKYIETPELIEIAMDEFNTQKKGN